MVSRRRFLKSSSALALIPVFKAGAATQAFPERPVTLVIPWPAGGPVDNTARMLSGGLMDKWAGVPVVFDYKTGASGLIGGSHVAKAKPDGYTLLVGAIQHSVLPSIRDDMPYDTVRQLRPITRLGATPNVLITRNSLDVPDLKAFIEYVKNQNGKCSYGSPGIGSASHLAMADFSLKLGLDAVHAPYKGTAPALTDLIGGQIDYMMSDIPSCLAHIEAGTVKAIAIASTSRNQAIPEVRTMREQGLENLESGAWTMLFAPSGVPENVLEKINSDVNEVLQTPSVIEAFAERGGVIVPSTRAEAESFFLSEMEKWRHVTEKNNIRMY